ncbi:hypothetical protein DL93DRAFT_2168243 [Clavulina sp. PMI_390]|nr:hypothetical protein DL93DRAFT_2168243 [Clavulina sp. PMI_390]
MRFAIALAALIASASALGHDGATPTRRDGAHKRLNPSSHNEKRSANSHVNPAPRSGRDTNAKRLAAGLPLLRPHRRFNPSRPHAPRQTSTACTNGVISVTVGSTGDPDNVAPANGYLSTELNEYGEYTTTVASSCDASVLQICAFTNQPGTAQSIFTTNAISSSGSPYLGVTAGFGNDASNQLGTGSANYVTITNTAQSDSSVENTENSYTDANGLDEPAESEVWTVATDGTMAVVWTNPDGTTAPASLIYSQDTFNGAGDSSTFEADYGSAGDVTFTFVASSSLTC